MRELLIENLRVSAPLREFTHFFTPSPARVRSFHVTVEAAEGTNPDRFWAHASISVFDRRFELSAFIFIDIVAIIE
jgi:hypothetical protein